MSANQIYPRPSSVKQILNKILFLREKASDLWWLWNDWIWNKRHWISCRVRNVNFSSEGATLHYYTAAPFFICTSGFLDFKSIYRKIIINALISIKKKRINWFILWSFLPLCKDIVIHIFPLPTSLSLCRMAF